jgi:UDP-N-acetylglucosamine 2-epimerase (non-hydrolysing)
VGSASHALQTARIMERFEPVCLEYKPDAVLVVGDVNSTAACVLVAVKLGIRAIHYEAGLRSRDRSMPEEINRLVTDSICDFFLTTSADADENLIAEGHAREKIRMVGNLMIDTLVHFLPRIRCMSVAPVVLGGGMTMARLREQPYAVMTFHRPNNVDKPEVLAGLVDQWRRLSLDLPLVFPIHPRTRKQLDAFGLWSGLAESPGMLLCEPLGYLPFMNLVCGSALVITDSGGVQEETTYLRIPCLTVRPSTERPVTIWQGSNKLIQPQELETEARGIMAGQTVFDRVPPLWDGRTAERVVEVLGQ